MADVEDAAGDVGSARRRRERRPCAMLRREWQSIAMFLATVSHHSFGMVHRVRRPTGQGDSHQDIEAARCPDGASAAGPGATMVFPSALTGRS